jgi:hypothetical protein
MSDRPDEPDAGDDLLASLGALARAQDEALDALPEDDDALRPPDAAEADAMFEAAFAAMGRAEEVEDDEAPAPLPFARPAAPPPPASAKPRRRPLSWAAGAVAALAAAVVVAVLTLADPLSLPSYTLTAGAGDQTMRADPQLGDGERATYGPGARLQLVARPAADVPGAVVARLYVRQGAVDTPVEAPLQISPSGAVRLDAVVGDTLTLPEGDGALVLLVRPADLDLDDAALLRAHDPAPARRLMHLLRFSR